MVSLVQMVGGAVAVIAVLGGAMATIFFAWIGIQWLASAGVCRKIGQTRMAFIGAVIGLAIAMFA